MTRVTYGHPDYGAAYLKIESDAPPVANDDAPWLQPLPAPRLGWFARVWRRIWG
jgi:hypothetical protein